MNLSAEEDTCWRKGKIYDDGASPRMKFPINKIEGK